MYGNFSRYISSWTYQNVYPPAQLLFFCFCFLCCCFSFFALYIPFHSSDPLSIFSNSIYHFLCTSAPLLSHSYTHTHASTKNFINLYAVYLDPVIKTVDLHMLFKIRLIANTRDHWSWHVRKWHEFEDRVRIVQSDWPRQFPQMTFHARLIMQIVPSASSDHSFQMEIFSENLQTT